MSEIDQILKSAPAHVPGGAPQQAAQPESEIDSALKEAPTTARGFSGWARDIAATAVKGAIAVPEAVVGLNASGQVRELELRLRVRFKLRTPAGDELIPDTELLQQREISYNEAIALAKEAEEALLFRNMQTDIVQQLLRRLAVARR